VLVAHNRGITRISTFGKVGRCSICTEHGATSHQPLLLVCSSTPYHDAPTPSRCYTVAPSDPPQTPPPLSSRWQHTRLRSVDVSFNRLKGGLGALGELPELRELKVYGNRLPALEGIDG
jgi:hypothetical protein